jgi:hypothetical protein
MIREATLRLSAMTLGIAGIVAATSTMSRAEYLQYTTTTSIISTTAPLTTITAGTETITQGTYVQTAPYAGVLAADGNEVRVVGLASNAAAPSTPASGPLGTDIVPVQFDIISPAGSLIDSVDFTYSTTITFKDYATAASTTLLGTGTITVTGRILGLIGNGQVSLQNFNFATVPASGIFTAGPDTFKVTETGFTPPGTSNGGTLGLHIVSVPEPASMALIGMGGLGAIGVFRRRKAAKIA